MGINNILALTGRVFLAMIFLASAFGKITNFDGTIRYMASYGMAWATFLCAAAIAVEILGGVSLALGFYAKSGAVGLLLYMVPVTLIFHLGFDQRVQLLKNIAIMGGLMQVVAFGPGRISLDHKPIL
jgi:putative oxidoreductase